MRDVIIFTLSFLIVSCSEMHDPILHSGGTIKFIPNIQCEVDSIIIQRMSDNFQFDWKEEMFYKYLNDFHVELINKNDKFNIDFIDESENIRTMYGNYDIIWRTNTYNNNILVSNNITTEHLNDTICKNPDFLYSKSGKIQINDYIHDYIIYEDKYVQIFRETLIQRVFLYIVQITLHNNNCVENSGIFSISGMAESVNLVDECNYGEVCLVFNTKKYNNFLIGQFTSFGIPDYNPYIFRYNHRNNQIKPNNKNILYIQLIYKTGRRIIEIDVSDQIALQPTGGLILVDLDINNYPEINNTSSDPFDVFVDDYENVNQYFNII